MTTPVPPSVDALRAVLAEHADDAAPLDPLGAATAPRLAGVHERVRRTRRRRAAGTALAAAAAVAAVVTVVTTLPTAPPAPARPALRTTSAALDRDGLPPLLDPAGRPLQAATSVDAAGPREATVRFTPTGDGDGGASLLVQCTGSSGARVAWFVGGRRGGDVRCGSGRGAAFVAPTLDQWRRLGAVPGRPAQVTLRVVGDDGGAATGEVPPATAIVGVYEKDDPAVQGPALRSGSVVGRQDGVAGLDRPVDLPYLSNADAPSRLVAATDLVATPGAIRAFRFEPGTLDGLVATAFCRESSDVLGGGSLFVAVAGRAYTELGCSDETGTAPFTWPRGDPGATWRGYGVPEGGPVTVVVRLTPLAERDRTLAPPPGEPVRERVPPRVDVGFYGVPAAPVDPPGAREASLAALSDPPATYEGLPLLGTRDLVAEDAGASLPVRGALRRVVVRYECVGRYVTLALMVERTTPDGGGTGTGAECDGSGPRRLGLSDDGDLSGLYGGSLDVSIGLGAQVFGSDGPIVGLSRSVVVRVSFYGR